MKRSRAVDFIAERLLTTVGLFGGARDEWEEQRERTKLYRIRLADASLKAMEDLGKVSDNWDKERYYEST